MLNTDFDNTCCRAISWPISVFIFTYSFHNNLFCYIQIASDENGSKGYAYINYESEEQAMNAILNVSTLIIYCGISDLVYYLPVYWVLTHLCLEREAEVEISDRSNWTQCCQRLITAETFLQKELYCSVQWWDGSCKLITCFSVIQLVSWKIWLTWFDSLLGKHISNWYLCIRNVYRCNL